ncbi:MAG: beta-glucosidase [Chloroflexi bacterium]|nr:beta-glucosidase [Chloroflexota bacterium]
MTSRASVTTSGLLEFPAGFVWGAATASYQIEGSADAHGKGPSIWDLFCRAPGAIENSDTGDVACDHYRRWREDLALMSQLGLGAYRFSISWPRVLPTGHGQVNRTGLDFYDRLVDGLLEAGIQPFVTLYHWDLPQALQEAGGWPARQTADHFAAYADVVSRRLGDRVGHWITLNEPWVAAYAGYGNGWHAPGIRNPLAAIAAAHHLLLAHGQAVPVLRANSRPEAQVGITLNLAPVHPASDREADQAAARRFDGFLNRWFLGPIFHGRYPEDLLTLLGEALPDGAAADGPAMAAPLDFLGINNYTRNVMANDPESVVVETKEVFPSGRPYTEMGWEVYPEGLYELLTRVQRDYAPPRIYVTENGATFPDALSGGRVHDPQRVDYLRGYIAQAHRALQEGVPLAGYFVWTLLDNFEWAYGYSKRFGLVYVDFGSQARILKDSAFWYREVIAQNGVR